MSAAGVAAGSPGAIAAPEPARDDLSAAVRRRLPRGCPLLGALLAVAQLACAAEGLPPSERDAARCRSAVRSGAATAASMRWTIIDDSAGRAVLDAYCAAAGPALIHAPQGRERGGAGDALVVVAWNIALGSGDVRRLIADLHAGRHTDGRPVAEFVLLLQEVPRIGAAVPPHAELPAGALVSSPDPVPGPDVLALARAERLHLLYVPSMREAPVRTTRTDHGTALLSTLPLAEHRAIELPAGIRRRVATAARLDWPAAEAPLYVVSVHLDNFSFARLIGSFGGIRGRQAAALARVLPQDGSVLLGGDLNTWATGTRESAYRALRARLPRPAELQPAPTARRLGVPRRLDYILADLPPEIRFAERRIDDRYGSDHHPLIAVLRRPEEQHLR
jgi:endonuclease/exonuclease/phosphatase family metal-dependent hydrolase